MLIIKGLHFFITVISGGISVCFYFGVTGKSILPEAGDQPEPGMAWQSYEYTNRSS